MSWGFFVIALGMVLVALTIEERGQANDHEQILIWRRRESNPSPWLRKNADQAGARLMRRWRRQERLRAWRDAVYAFFTGN